jgi:hypothetical protein
MAALRIKGTLFTSVDALPGSNADSDMIYVREDVDRLKKKLKKEGHKVRVIKHYDFWVVYKASGPC